MSLEQSHVSRRTIAKGAAWSVPAVAVAAAAPALAASQHCETTYQSITKQFTYTDAVNGIVTVTVTADNVPLVVSPGATLLPIETTSVVQISENSANILRSIILTGAKFIDGTSTSTSTLSGAYSDTTTSELTIPMTPMPSSGPITTEASGTGAAGSVPADASAGGVTITMGSPTSVLNAYDANQQYLKSYTSTLTKISGNDYTLGTFTVCA